MRAWVGDGAAVAARGSDLDGARGKVGLESEASERADLRRPMCSRDGGGRGGRGPCLDLPR